MHKLLFTICTLFTLSAIAQDSSSLSHFPTKDGKIYYEQTMQIDSVNKDELYQRAFSWSSLNYPLANELIQTQDKKAGILSYSSYFMTAAIPVKVGLKKIFEIRTVWHAVKIQVKDNEASIIFTDVKLRSGIYEMNTVLPSRKSTATDFWYIEDFDKKNEQHYFKGLDQNFRARMDSLTQYLKKPL